MGLFADEMLPLVEPCDDPREWMQAISTALTDSMFENTWSLSAGSAARAVFLFDNGLHMSWLVSGSEGEPEVMQVWVNPEVAGDWYPSGVQDAEPMPCPVAPDLAEWHPRTQSWLIEGCFVDEATDLVQMAVDEFGPVTVALPWMDFENDESVDAILSMFGNHWERKVDFRAELPNVDETALAEVEETLEEFEDTMAAPVLAAAILNGVYPPTSWGTTPAVTGMGDDWLPPQCPIYRFNTLMQAMSEDPGWVVSWDECCGTCYGSTYRMLCEDKGLVAGEAPGIGLFGQNSQYYMHTDGTVGYQIYLGNAEQVEYVLTQAKNFGVEAYPSADNSITFD